MINTLKGVALIYFLIKRIRDKYPDIQIGKTVVQKMAYLFERERSYDFDFSMYHYGPYSAKISNYLDLAESLGLLNITWKPEKGYFIEPTNLDQINKTHKKIQEIVSEEDKEKINKIVESYGKLNPIAVKLSIITTAIYIRENFKVPEERIKDIVKALKPQHSHLVEETLKNLNI